MLVMFGSNVIGAAPGSARGHYLVVADIEAACADSLRRAVEISEACHDAGGVFHRSDGDNRVSCGQPERKSYASFATFSDPHRNRWFLQEDCAPLGACRSGRHPVHQSDRRCVACGGESIVRRALRIVHRSGQSNLKQELACQTTFFPKSLRAANS
jgi:hypothetical protein